MTVVWPWSKRYLTDRRAVEPGAQQQAGVFDPVGGEDVALATHQGAAAGGLDRLDALDLARRADPQAGGDGLLAQVEAGVLQHRRQPVEGGEAGVDRAELADRRAAAGGPVLDRLARARLRQRREGLQQLCHRFVDRAERMRRKSSGARNPWSGLSRSRRGRTGDAERRLGLRVEGLQLGQRERPVLHHPEAGAHLEVGGVEAERGAGPVQHRAADPVDVAPRVGAGPGRGFVVRLGARGRRPPTARRRAARRGSSAPRARA